MGSDYDRLRDAHREALERAAKEPEPDVLAARHNADERLRQTAGPGPDMVSSGNWARRYDEKVQARQAELHAADKAKDGVEPPRHDAQERPTERDKIEARKSLTVEHEVARQNDGSSTPNADGAPEQTKRKSDDYRRFEHEITDRERNEDRDGRPPSKADEYRRDFGERTRER